MNTEQKKIIKNTILACRELLEKDIEQVLINYGIYVNKNWINKRDLYFTEEQANIRKKIESAIEKLQKGGFDKNEAVKEYIKEVSYTNLNRLAALRVMEVRGLMDEILISRIEYGNKSFIGSRFYEVAREYCKFEMDGGLSYLLNVVFNEISEEMQMLFNMEDEYSYVVPSSNSLLKVIDLLCNDIDEESWKQDEIIGWIYQYFNDKEKDDVFDRLYNKKEKIRVEDIPAATQLFTPDWIVKWIVENSLGALWGDIKEGKMQWKKVEDIKLLDPCCGSGHFLVKSYDIFYQMYKEEGIYTKEEIPFKILENNLYGIDIDLRAVQLTALVLFIKTRTYLKGTDITNLKGKLAVNLVCADAILLNGSRLESLREKNKNNITILKMIDIIYEEFQDVRLKGSLIRPEKKLFPLFEEYKNRVAKDDLNESKKLKKKQVVGQTMLIEDEIMSFSEYKSNRNFSKEEKELIQSLNVIYYEAIKSNDISKQLFATETVKSIKLVDIFMKQYDIVITNPPYMGKRSMTDKMKTFLKSNYGDNFVDLYSSFIDRCLDFTVNNGYVGMVTQNSFMFTSSFTSLRTKILDNFFIYKLSHLGSKAFSDISGEKVNTVMFVFNKNKSRRNEDGEYLRLVNYENSYEKEKALKRYHDSDIYRINQMNFKNISNYPFTYWASSEIFNLFNRCKPFEDYVKPKQGMATGNNAKYLRFKWELSSFDNWNKYSKIIDNSQYYTYYPTYVLWKNNGEEIRKNPSSAVRGEDYFFKEGIMYSLIGKEFKSRYLPEGIIYDKGNSCIFPEKFDIDYLLAFTNSKIFSYLINILNPTNNFQVGDIKRIPVIEPSNELVIQIKDLVSQIIIIRKKILQNVELFDDFRPFKKSYDNFNDYLYDVLSNELVLELKIKILEEAIDNKINSLYAVSEKDKRNMESEIGKYYFGKFLNYKNIDDIDLEVQQIELPIKDKDTVILINDTLKQNNFNIYSVSDEMNIDIIELVKTIIENKLYNYQRTRELVNSTISFFIKNIIINDYETCDGIFPLNNSIYGENDIVERIYEVISNIFNENNADEVLEEIENTVGVSFEDYFIKDFFEEHKIRYQKRPIYWHICSPKKTFNCFVYFHKLDDDTLYKVKSMYLGKMIERYKDDLKYYSDQFIVAKTNNDKKEKDFRSKCSDLEFKLDDLYSLDRKIMEILPYKPDIDQGVLYNIIPLEPILSSMVSTDKEREEHYKEVKK